MNLEKARRIYKALKKVYSLSLEDLPNEIWCVVPDFEDYHCSNYGRVKSFKNGKVKILKPSLDKDGYLRVNLYKDSKAKTFRVNRLVAELFIPNPDNKPEVNHVDGNKFNNHFSNLVWATTAENIHHAWATGLSKAQQGADCHKAKLTPAQVEQIRLNPDGLTQNQLAEKFGVGQKSISEIQTGKTYKNAGGIIRGKQQHPARVPDEKREEIRIRFAAGVKVRDLAEQYGVNKTMICRILKEKKNE